MLCKCVLVVLTLAHLTASSKVPVVHFDLESTDVGNWTVGDCILAQFAMELQFDPRNQTDLKKTVTIKVPKTAKVDEDLSTCGPTDQSMVLYWTDRTINETGVNRNLTVSFARNNKTGYGVDRIFGTFELAHFNSTQEGNKTNVTELITSSVTVDSGIRTLDKLMFLVPLNRSYLCHDIGQAQLYTHLHFSFKGAPHMGRNLPNTTIGATNVAFDAFRPSNAPKRTYQTPMDCDYEPSDVVPIAVGIALAAMVVFVLVAYLLGRRRRRQLGYQSV